VEIRTQRTVLRPWREEDREALAAMHADPEVMHDWPAPFSRAQSDWKFDNYAAGYLQNDYGRMRLGTIDGTFLGYLGINSIPQLHAQAGAGDGVEIGWRMIRAAWGQGYATEAARAALDDGFDRLGFKEILTYTSPTNVRSQGVMLRVGLSRDASRDFAYEVDGVTYPNVVFVAYPPEHRVVSFGQ
jgi:RimJ/RimL family protein N-acetyltransferase